MGEPQSSPPLHRPQTGLESDPEPAGPAEITNQSKRMAIISGIIIRDSGAAAGCGGGNGGLRSSMQALFPAKEQLAASPGLAS